MASFKQKLLGVNISEAMKKLDDVKGESAAFEEALKNTTKKGIFKKEKPLSSNDIRERMKPLRKDVKDAEKELKKQKGKTLNTRVLTGAGLGVGAIGVSKLKGSEPSSIEHNYNENYEPANYRYLDPEFSKSASIKKKISDFVLNPEKFKNSYSVAASGSLGNKIKDVAMFGGYKRGGDALKYVEDVGDIKKLNINPSLKTKLDDFKANRNGYAENKKDIADLQEELNKVRGRKYFDEAGSPAKYKEKYPDTFEKEIGKFNQKNRSEEASIMSSIRNKTRNMNDEGEFVAREANDIIRARDNELAKSIGLYGVGLGGLGYGFDKLRRMEDE